MKPEGSGADSWLRQRQRSFGYAWRGVLVLLREQPHARLHLLATALAVGLGLWLDLDRADWQSLLLTIALVWLAEGLNSALEYLGDAAVPEHHPLVGKAKDVAAGAVLICSLFALAMAALIFPPYLV